MSTLIDYVIDHGSTPFVWGRNDCVLFVSGWIKQAKGVAVLEGITPWHDYRTACRSLAEVGGLETAVLQRLGEPTKRPKDGDVALVDAPHNCMGIVSGSDILVLSEDGLISVDIAKAKYIWNI